MPADKANITEIHKYVCKHILFSAFSSHLPIWKRMTQSRYDIEIVALGKNVRKFRKKKGWTQVDLETNSGITQADLSRIESGSLDVQFSSIVRIAEALDVPTKVLLDEK